MVLDASLLNTQHYKVRIKGEVEQSREGVAPSPTHCCSSYRKGSLRVTLDNGRQLYFFTVLCCLCSDLSHFIFVFIGTRFCPMVLFSTNQTCSTTCGIFSFWVGMGAYSGFDLLQLSPGCLTPESRPVASCGSRKLRVFDHYLELPEVSALYLSLVAASVIPGASFTL